MQTGAKIVRRTAMRHGGLSPHPPRGAVVLENTGRLEEPQAERMAVRARPRIGWRAPLIAGALAIALAAALYAVDRDRSSVAPAAHARTITGRGLASLPLGAQG